MPHACHAALLITFHDMWLWSLEGSIVGSVVGTLEERIILIPEALNALRRVPGHVVSGKHTAPGPYLHLRWR